MDPMDPKKEPLTKGFVYIVCAVAAINNCNLGYDIGIVSGVGPLLQKQDRFEVDDVRLEMFIGALDVASLIGAFSSNYLADRFGRKGCMALSEFLFIVSVLGMACAQSYLQLVLFRCVCGVAVGLGLTIGPLYIGEIAPDAIRGKLISWSELATNVGLLVAFAGRCHNIIAYSIPMQLSFNHLLILYSCILTISYSYGTASQWATPSAAWAPTPPGDSCWPWAPCCPPSCSAASTSCPRVRGGWWCRRGSRRR
jgi:MFS family permease